MQTFTSDLVAGSSAHQLRLRLKSAATKAPIDLTDQVVKVRWQLGQAAVQERTMTVLTPQSDPANKGRVTYLFVPDDLPTAGVMTVTVRLIDNAAREFPSSTKLILTVGHPLTVAL